MGLEIQRNGIKVRFIHMCMYVSLDKPATPRLRAQLISELIKQKFAYVRRLPLNEAQTGR